LPLSPPCTPTGDILFNELRHAGRRVLREIPSRSLNQGKSPCVLVFTLWKGQGRLTRALTKQYRGCCPRCSRRHPRHLARQVGARYSSSSASSVSASSTTPSLCSLWPCPREEMVRPGRPLLAPIYMWLGLKDPVRFNTNYSVHIRYQLVFQLCL
jgi:hypothetical protein